MARYIDVEPLEDKLKEHIKKTESELMLGALSTFLRLLDITPTADVAPVRRGHWDFYDGKWYCSVCGYCMEWCLSKPIEDWCGSCGARMDGGNDEID